MKASGILNFCHIRDDLFALIGVAPTACSALDWFVSNLAGNDSLELLSRKAAGITAGSDGLIMLPHLAGSGSPRPDPSAKGLFYGLQLHQRLNTSSVLFWKQ